VWGPADQAPHPERCEVSEQAIYPGGVHLAAHPVAFDAQTVDVR